MNIITTEVTGTAFDGSTASYTVEEPESLVGVEITDLGGKLQRPHVAAFITCGREGSKIFLTADQARGFAEVLTAMADRLDAGAASAAVM